MAKINRTQARTIVCDALSGALTMVPNKPSSDDLPVKRALQDIFAHDPEESISIYNYIRKRVKNLGWPFDMTPDIIEMPPFETVGDLITEVQVATEK